ncbi:MAG: hypothetical protein ACTSPB_18660, partial [Candidatus Thorarchaeota archaeon]
MNMKEASKLAKEIESQGYQANLTGYIGSKVVDIKVIDHITGYTMTIESPEEWEERERLSKLYSKVY